MTTVIRYLGRAFLCGTLACFIWSGLPLLHSCGAAVNFAFWECHENRQFHIFFGQFLGLVCIFISAALEVIATVRETPEGK